MAQGTWQKTRRLIEQAHGVLEAENSMTVRQCFYRLVSQRVLRNSRKDYQKLSRVLTLAREQGDIPFDWIVDRSRPTYTTNAWDDPKDYMKTCKLGYRKDYWQLQPNYCELWTEKDAIIGSISEVTDELGVTVRVGRGFLSTTKAHDIADLLQRIRKPKTVFYLGDHDPSGRCIEREAAERIRKYGSGRFAIQRLAIHAEDIAKFSLPPLRVKTKRDGDYADSRAEEFIAEYGSECVELDALPVSELRRRIREAVEAKIERTTWNRAVLAERAELESIEDFIANWPHTGA
jgi:hypothetical protein